MCVCVGWERVRRQEKRERERVRTKEQHATNRSEKITITSASMDLTSQNAAGSADSSRCFYTGQNIDAVVSHT